MTVRVTGFRISGVEAFPVEVEVTNVDTPATSLRRSTVKGVDAAVARELQLAADANGSGSGPSSHGVVVQVLLGEGEAKASGRAMRLDGAVALGAWAARLNRSEPTVEGWGVCAHVTPTGELRPTGGVFLAAEAAKRLNLKGLVVGPGSGEEAAAVSGLKVVAARTVAEAMECVLADRALLEARQETGRGFGEVDLGDVLGNAAAKRVLEIAAAGGHSVLMVGAAGTGKTMLARRFGTILPPMSREEAVEATRIYSAANLGNRAGGLISERPFRAPHHSISDCGLVGGGTYDRPGEASLAHRGTLFLDEVSEFPTHVIEALREPAKDGEVTVARADRRVTYPANFSLIAAMNPCPCGGQRGCRCSESDRENFERRTAAKAKGLFTLTVGVEHAPREAEPGDSSEVVRARVVAAREFAKQRGEWTQATAVERRHGRPVAAVARTIADLAGSVDVSSAHIEEATRWCPQARVMELGVAR